MNNVILSKQIKDILFLKLNRPEKRNALNPTLVEEFQHHLDLLSENKDIRVVILTGAGKAFCAGADLAYLDELTRYNNQQNLADSKELAALFKALFQLPKITLGMINGPALAGGFGLALCCDYLLADIDEAILGFTETRIGFVPAIVMNILIRKLPINLARHLVLSGEILPAKKAIKTGVINFGYKKNELEDKTVQFAENLLTHNSFNAMIQTKQLFLSLLDLPLTEGLDLAIQVNTRSRTTDDCRNGLQAFLKKTKINWR